MEYTKNSKSKFSLVTTLALALALPAAASAEPQFTAMGDGGDGAEVRRYLEQVHERLHRQWADGELERAKNLLDAKDPFNDSAMSVVVELSLDRRGAPGWSRVARSSGHPPFDAAAIRVLASVRKLPQLPVLNREGHLFLRWTFHRDHRRCSPEHAELLVLELSKAEELARAMERQDYPRAARLLKQADNRHALLAEVVRAGLANKDLTHGKRVLPLAYSSTLESVCRRHGTDPLGREALAELGRREATASIERLLASAGPGGTSAHHGRAWRMLILRALRRMEARPAAASLAPMLASEDAAVVFAAAPLVKDAAQLDAILPRWRGRPAVAGPLWVRRCHLADDGACAERMGGYLSGQGRRSTLRGLRGYPLPGAMTHVARLVRKEQHAATRVDAIKTLTAYHSAAPLSPLFSALAAEEQPKVVMAAAAALGKLGRRPLAASYRLAEVGYKRRKGDVAATVLAAMAALGHENFRQDVVRLGKALTPERQARVVRGLWGFGDSARPYLKKLVASEHTVLAEAAKHSLDELDGVISAAVPTPPPAPTNLAGVRTLDDMIRLALKLRKTR